MKKFKSTWLTLFVISALAVLLSILFTIDLVYMLAKPLLMITLLLYFISASQGYSNWRFLVMLALVFSWGGDVLLMQDGLFIAGLASFLVAHLFYISAYYQTGAARGKLTLFDVIKFAFFGIVLMWVLYPGLGDLLVYVLAYAVILLSMGVVAHKRRGATSEISFMLVATGALLFVISDSLIALNKFAFDLPAERFLVMSTYISAQLMIIQGLLAHERA